MRAGLILDATAPVVVHMTYMQARNLRPSTVEARRRALSRFCRWLADDGAPDELLAATEDQVERFLGRLARPESRATELSHLRGFYRWALLHDPPLIERDPTVRLHRPRIKRRLPRPMPDHLVDEAIRQAPHERVRPALLLAAYAGLRAQDMAGLSMSDFWWGHRPPTIFIPDPKGGNEETVPMPSHLVEQLAECGLPTSGWVFPRWDRRPGHVHPWSISGWSNRYLHSLGITHTLHTLRHWFVTQVHRANGGDLLQTAELARHRSLNSTRGYAELDKARAARVVEKLPALGMEPVSTAFGDDAA